MFIFALEFSYLGFRLLLMSVSFVLVYLFCNLTFCL
nr:MAG TPA: hypothetical protein [Microviridae sp.]